MFHLLKNEGTKKQKTRGLRNIFGFKQFASSHLRAGVMIPDPGFLSSRFFLKK
jgi:hypothetical protein